MARRTTLDDLVYYGSLGFGGYLVWRLADQGKLGPAAKQVVADIKGTFDPAGRGVGTAPLPRPTSTGSGSAGSGDPPMDPQNYVAPWQYGYTVVVNGRRIVADSSGDNYVWTDLPAAQREYTFVRFGHY